MNTKLKIALALLLLFAGLFVFTMSVAPGSMVRYARPLVVLVILGFIIYGAVTVLRNVPSFESKDPTPGEGCEDGGCGCRTKQTTTTRPEAPKAAPVNSKGK